MLTWFGLCMASALWIALGLGVLAFAPGWWNLAGPLLVAVGIRLGYRAYLEDLK